MTRFSGDRNVLRHRAGSLARASEELEAAASVRPALLTLVALATRDRRVDCNMLTNLQYVNTGADLHHGSRTLMAESRRMVDDLVTNAPCSVVMNVRSAHTNRFDSQQHIARPLQNRPWSLTNLQFPYAGENRNIHLFSTPPIECPRVKKLSG